MTEIETLVRRYYDAFNARDLAAYDSLFAADAVLEAPGMQGRGVDAMRGFDKAYFAAFPEARIESLRLTTAGNHLVTGNWIHGGPQRGPLVGPGGTIPPTGKVLSAPYCSMFTAANGKIQKQIILFDPSWIPIQLGLV